MTLKILFNNINSFNSKKYQIFNCIENLNINCALFAETKLKDIINYRNWQTINKAGNILNKNIRGGQLVLCNPNLKMIKANSPQINNAANGCIHFCISFKNDFLHIFNVYIHPLSLIEETIFTMASIYKYSLIIGDFNAGNNAK